MFASKFESISIRHKQSADLTSDYAAAFRRGATALLGACALSACLAAAPAEAGAFRIQTQTLSTGGDPVPAAAAAAGYRMETLASDSFSPRTVDTRTTYGRGFQWYFWNFFGAPPLPSTTTFNADGSINVASAVAGWSGVGANMTSAGVIRGAPGFVGTAYGGGGYFEATFAFNNSAVVLANGWPSWWSMALEHMIFKGDQWVGQKPGYEHYIEPDFFEYDAGGGPYYGGAVHDWYGVYNATCSNYCNYQPPWSVVSRSVPANTNFNQYHRYGFLWKPATATTKGSLTYYFDGVQVGSAITYTKFTNQAPVPTAGTPWTFGIIDQQHLVLDLGSGPPVPMKIKSVQVWQANATNNMHN